MRHLVAAMLVLAVISLPDQRPSIVRAQETGQAGFRILVFTRTMGFRHDSIPDGVDAVVRLGAEHGFGVDSTDDPAVFTEANLAGYQAVVFLLTTGDVLEPTHETAFERYIGSGGGYVGVHSASDTEYGWPFYGGLVGAYFASHPEIQPALISIEDGSQASTAGLPAGWLRTDEWYNFRSNPRDTPGVRVVATLDESTYTGGTMGDHPITWMHEYAGGRAWYTAAGHTRESYAEPLFQVHLLGGILYAAGF
jgi:type 1 glutamine amidotransferase